MPKYLITAQYSTDGVKGVLKEGGSGRREAVEKLAASLGATVESFYFAFGATDAFVIVDAPDNVSAAAASLAASAGGGAATSVTVLLTPEEIDAASQKSADYRAPGK